MNLHQKTVLITGATDGLGKAVALEFAGAGATILLHGRNPQKGEYVLKQLPEGGRHRYYNADLASLNEVRQLSDEIVNKHKQLDILINNAGIGSGNGEQEFGVEGYELRLTVNYLAPFVLTRRLLPLLCQSAPSRIVNVASGSQQVIDFGDVMINKAYSGSRAYAQSKLALIMFSFDLADELKDSGITVNCLHPASMMDTKLVREFGGKPRTDVSEGVETVKYVATSAKLASITGKFFDHKEEVKADAQAYDLNARKALHDLSLDMTHKFL